LLFWQSGFHARRTLRRLVEAAVAEVADMPVAAEHRISVVVAEARISAVAAELRISVAAACVAAVPPISAVRCAVAVFPISPVVCVAAGRISAAVCGTLAAAGRTSVVAVDDISAEEADGTSAVGPAQPAPPNARFPVAAERRCAPAAATAAIAMPI
jgi:hypothetical protein